MTKSKSNFIAQVFHFLTFGFYPIPHERALSKGELMSIMLSKQKEAVAEVEAFLCSEKSEITQSNALEYEWSPIEVSVPIHFEEDDGCLQQQEQEQANDAS